MSRQLSGYSRLFVYIKNMGYSVKLDTNGTFPGVLEEMIDKHLVDHIAMDIKAPFDKYDKVSGVCVDTTAVLASIRLIENSGIDYHFRTTYSKEFLSDCDIASIKRIIVDPAKYIIQDCIERIPAAI